MPPVETGTFGVPEGWEESEEDCDDVASPRAAVTQLPKDEEISECDATGVARDSASPVDLPIDPRPGVWELDLWSSPGARGSLMPLTSTVEFIEFRA